MNLYSHLDINKFIVVGDIHGEFKQFFHKIRINSIDKVEEIEKESLLDSKTMEEFEPYLENVPSSISRKFFDYGYDLRQYGRYSINNCLIIVSGDCGFGFEKEEYYHQIFNKYIKLLEKNNIYVYFIRGNHDNPSYFEEQKINYERIKTIPDYSVIQIENKNILCVGGGISIDRSWRKQEEFRINKYKKNNKKVLYWENEAPLYCQEKLEEIIQNNININTIISHTSPYFVFPTQKDGLKEWARVDNKLYNDVEKERYTLNNVLDFLLGNKQKIENWYYGHFHTNYHRKEKNIHFYALSEMQFMEIVPQIEKKENDGFWLHFDTSFLSTISNLRGNVVIENPQNEERNEE